MWKVCWEDKSKLLHDRKEVLELIEKLNEEYLDQGSIIVRVENDSGDTLCMGIGNKKGYSFIDYISHDGYMAKRAEGENVGDDIISFNMGGYESEFYISETIKYQTALAILKQYLLNNSLDNQVKWIDD